MAIFILQKILLDDQGLQYICGTYDRFLAVAQVLSVMVNVLVEQQAVRLLKHVVRCYLRLSDHPKYSLSLPPRPNSPYTTPVLFWVVCLVVALGGGLFVDRYLRVELARR